MANVDRNILRMGIFEMLYYAPTPVNVAIDEALELAKTFSHKDAPRFINGILGRIARDRGLQSTCGMTPDQEQGQSGGVGNNRAG
jgi:N utilization substance protein B